MDLHHPLRCHQELLQVPCSLRLKASPVEFQSRSWSCATPSAENILPQNFALRVNRSHFFRLNLMLRSRRRNVSSSALNHSSNDPANPNRSSIHTISESFSSHFKDLSRLELGRRVQSSLNRPLRRIYPLSVMKQEHLTIASRQRHHPDPLSSLNQHLDPATSLTMASKNGIGHAVLSQRAFTALKSTHILLLPSAFFTTTTGEAHSEFIFFDYAVFN